MTKGFTIAALILAASLSAQAQECKSTYAQVGFIYPLSTNGTKSGEYATNFAFNALAGVSGSVKGFGLSGITGVVKDTATGLQLSGFSNHMGTMRGAAIGGFINTTRRSATGLQLGGFMNIAGSTVGMQIGGFANISGESSKSMQLAGFINKSKNVNSQLAGFINVARDVEGLQMAGFINKARKVKGVQLAGFINVADSSDYPIGFINIIKNGEKSVGASIDENMTTLITFRSGGKKLYGIVGAGYNFKSTSDALWAFEAGMGYHIPLSRFFRVNLEATNVGLTDFYDGTYFKSSFRTLLSMKAGRNLEIYAGPTLNYVTATEGFDEDLNKHYLWHAQWYGQIYGLNIGGIAGVNICF